MRMSVECTECEKPRCIYAKNKLTPRELRNIKMLIQCHDYSCGAVITTDGKFQLYLNSECIEGTLDQMGSL